MALATGRFPRIFYLLAPALSMTLFFASIELGLSFLSPVPFAAETNMYYQPDPYTGFRLKPDSIGQFVGGIVASVNRHGHRDDDVAKAKPAAGFRAMILGDSFTMGANVDQEDIYTEVLEGLFERALEVPMEVINTGVGGWGPFQYAQYFEHYGQRFEPDLVLVGFFVGNDAYSPASSVDQLVTAVMGRRVRREAAEGSELSLRLKIFAYRHSNLARLFFNRRIFTIAADDLRVRGGTSRDSDLFTRRYLEAQAKRMKRIHRQRSESSRRQNENAVFQISRIKELAGRSSAQTLLVMIPDENQINSALFDNLVDAEERQLYDLAMPQELLGEMFAEAGIPVIDLLPYFLADERRLYMNDTHWNEDGHRLAAERIFDVVEPLIRWWLDGGGGRRPTVLDASGEAG